MWKNNLLLEVLFHSQFHLLYRSMRLPFLCVLFLLIFKPVLGQDLEWKPLGPFQQTTPMYNSASPHGIGKVQCIAVKNKRKIFVGTNTAGIWQTKNKGKTWNNVLDYPHQLGVLDIEIHPKKKRVIFIGTGSNPYNNKNYGVGVLRSTNGGKTWDTTGLSFTPYEFDQTMVRKVKVHPTEKNTVYASTDHRVYKSIDLGDTWKEVLHLEDAIFTDIEIDPFDPSKVHVLGKKWFYSNNGGDSWVDKTELLIEDKRFQKLERIGRIELTFSPDQQDMFVIGYNGIGTHIAMSLDGGETISQMPNNTSNYTQIDEHVMCLEFLNDSKGIVVGGVRISFIDNLVTGHIQSIGSRIPDNKDYIHDDIREIDVYKNTIYTANDGGVARYDFENQEWIHMTGTGLTITQFYGISNNEIDPYFILGGAQDMSTQMLKDGVWYNQTALYGDGGKALHHPEKFHKVWCVRSGVLFHSTDTGKTWKWDSPIGGNGPFNSIIKFADSTLYYASNNVYKRNEESNTWINTTKKLNLRRNVSAFDVFEKNANIQVFAEEEPIYNKENYRGKLFKTTDGGESWIDLTKNLKELAWMYTTDVLFHPEDSNTMWLSMGLFHAAENKHKVFYTTDGGETWENISSNLPSYPTTCLFYKDGLLFVGTDIGLYYKKDGEKEYKKYGEGLPNVYISEIVYNKTVNKLRVATFGMGVWEVDFVGNL